MTIARTYAMHAIWANNSHCVAETLNHCESRRLARSGQIGVRSIAYTDAEVGVDADVSYGAGDVAVRPELDVLVVHYILLGEAEVDDMDSAVLPEPASSDEEVVRLDVAVDQLVRVDQREPV